MFVLVFVCLLLLVCLDFGSLFGFVLGFVEIVISGLVDFAFILWCAVCLRLFGYCVVLLVCGFTCVCIVCFVCGWCWLVGGDLFVFLLVLFVFVYW